MITILLTIAYTYYSEYLTFTGYDSDNAQSQDITMVSCLKQEQHQEANMHIKVEMDENDLNNYNVCAI